MIAFIASFTFVVLAEMGDKTQLLAMAFAARYKAWQVLVAVFLATIFNHALAVLAGHYLTTMVPLDLISLLAALSFIGFGLWTIRGDTLDGEDKKPARFGPIVTVGIAFFLAEMGDKTQLATISLAVKYSDMVGVLMGTTAGMIVADAVGIIIGVVMCRRIPDRAIKWVSAVIFMLFGFSGVWHLLAERTGIPVAAGITAALAGVTAWAARRIARQSPRGDGFNKIECRPKGSIKENDR